MYIISNIGIYFTFRKEFKFSLLLESWQLTSEKFQCSFNPSKVFKKIMFMDFSINHKQLKTKEATKFLKLHCYEFSHISRRLVQKNCLVDTYNLIDS